MKQRRSPRCRQCNGITNPAEVDACRTCQYSGLTQRLEAVGQQVVTFQTARDRTATICIGCIAVREPHVTNAIADGSIRKIAPLPAPCQHCGRRA